MAESTTLEPVVTSPDIQTDAALPVSDAGLEDISPASVEQDAASQDHGDVDDNPEPESFDYDAIQAKIDAKEPISTAEKDYWRRETQSRADRELADKQARETNAQIKQAVNNAVGLFDQALLRHVKAELETAEMEGRGVSETILSTALKAERDQFIQGVTPLLMHNLDSFLKSKIHEVHPDKAEADKVLDRLESSRFNIGNTLQAFADAVAKAAVAESDQSKELAKLKKDNDRLRADLEKAKGARGTGNSPSGDGQAASKAPINVKSLSPQQVEAMMRDPEESKRLASALAAQR